MNTKIQAGFLVLVILIVDQVSKFWIKTNMQLNESFAVLGDWFHILFTENPGMAFGWAFGGDGGKLFLTLFRIVVVGFGCFYLWRLFDKPCSKGFLLALSAILAGALGNIIDSVFYGMFFDSSFGQVAQFMPAEGYASLFHGHVVDMLYFPLIESTYPDFIPFWGGQPLVFFRFIFNIADSAVCVGVFYIMIFERKTLRTVLHNEEQVNC